MLSLSLLIHTAQQKLQKLLWLQRNLRILNFVYYSKWNSSVALFFVGNLQGPLLLLGTSFHF